MSTECNIGGLAMIIQSIELSNFRCFENLQLKLDKQCTIIVGNNGAGKSTILDALSIGVGSFFTGFDGIIANGINKDDARYKMYELGSSFDMQAQFPVEIKMEGSFDSTIINWKRSLNKENGKTTIIDAKQITKYANHLQSRIREGDVEVVLPLIAYYGTGRLWMQKKAKRKSDLSNKNYNRINGYVDCLDVASNEKIMLDWFEKMTYIELQEGKIIPELEAVRRALSQCYLGIEKNTKEVKFLFNVKTHELEISIIKENEEKERLPLKMLSEGLKSTLSLVADIAYRMAVLNPQFKDDILLKTSGIVLIDEIDMHLHPKWQRRIVGDLRGIFPEIQFVFTTHSPSVIVNSIKDQVLILDNYSLYEPANTTYGRDVEAILREVMKVEVRPDEIVNNIKAFYEAIDCSDVELAGKILNELEQILGLDDEEVISARITYDLEQI